MTSFIALHVDPTQRHAAGRAGTSTHDQPCKRTSIIAIFPMMFAKGVGGEILAPMALPVFGGLLISDEVDDLILPVRFYWVRRARWLKLHGRVDTGPVTQSLKHISTL